MTGAGTAWGYVLAAADVVIALGISAHIALNKRDDRAAVTWLTLVWFSPFVGAALYWMFGVNRIARRAIKLRGPRPAIETGATLGDAILGGLAGPAFLAYEANLIERFRQAPASSGNLVCPLRAGDVAFPDMLRAIEEAKSSVALATYIFNDDVIGRRFVEALCDAQGRGVQVRVLIDGVGALYSFPPIIWRLRRRGVRTERFLASLLPWRMTYLNLRNH